MNKSNEEESTPQASESIFTDVIAGMQTILAIVEYNTITDNELAMIAALVSIGVATLFFGAAVWSTRQPFSAFVAALSIYVVFNVASMVLSEGKISGFYILKILVVIALVRAITSAKEISKINESMGT